MNKILITHPIAEKTIAELGLVNAGVTIVNNHIYLYLPEIGANQIPDEANDPTLTQLCQTLKEFQPHVLIVGSNAVPKKAIISWRNAVGKQQKLLIIRRGVDTRAIDVKTAELYNVQVTNLPGINSPYVAQHLLKYLKLDQAQAGSKIGIIGVGNIGKEIALKAIDYQLDVHLFSPSLQNPSKRLETLNKRGIDPNRVTCASSITAAIQGAKYLAIAIPWLNESGIPNADLITQEHIYSLSPHAIIVSASVPGVFSPKALAQMDDLAQKQDLTVRIDTAKRHAESAKVKYPHLDIAYNQAFASAECQQALDKAMLAKARNFGLKPSYRLHNGFRMPLGFPPEGFTSGLQYRATPEDTFIVTYPKCGTTWTQYIIWLLLRDGKPMDGNQTLNQDIPHLEEVGKDIVSALSPPRFIKTHLPYHLTPHHPQAKYIYVARNPFDCVVSFYHHTRGFVQHYDFAEGSFSDFFDCFLAGEVDFGDYFDHLLSWYEHYHDSNLLWLTYEELKANPEDIIKRIASFIGDNYRKKLENPEILKKIVENSSFKQMSQQQQRWCSRRPENMPSFIRKGEVGDWRNYLSNQQLTLLKQKLITKTQGTELAKLWL